MTISALSSGSQETAPRNTAENTVKHRDGGVGLVVADHHGGSESSVVVTTVLQRSDTIDRVAGTASCMDTNSPQKFSNPTRRSMEKNRISN